MNSLLELHLNHQGKVSDKWSIYLTEYDRIFEKYRDKPLRILEIGVQNGGSLEVWAKYFLNAKVIVGCDIDEKCAQLKFDDIRIKIVVGNANSNRVEKLISEFSDKFDIIIDDGSHTSSDIIKSFARYFPYLTEGGIYIAEDLHCSYWQEFEGGLYFPHSSLGFFKTLTDIINHEHWGIEKTRTDILKGISKEFSTNFDESTLKKIHSLEFFNSVCVVHKEIPNRNTLGNRLIGGIKEDIISGQKLSRQTGSAINQCTNFWSTLETSPAETWIKTTQHNMVLKEQIQTHQQEVIDQKSTILALNKALTDSIEDITKLNKTSADRDIQITVLNQTIADRDEHIHKLSDAISQIHNSTSWRISKPYRIVGRLAISLMSGVRQVIKGIRLRGGLIGTIKKAITVCRLNGLAGFRAGVRGLIGSAHVSPNPSSDGHDRNDYAEWIRRYDTLTDDIRAKMQRRQTEFEQQPLISVLMPTYNTKPEWLIEAIESVKNQIYPNWELCIADDASTDPSVRRILEEYRSTDNRIKVIFRQKNGHISAASNSALELVTGDWVALLDHDDLLAEHALFWVIDTINQIPNVSLIYSDEDKITETGERLDPYFKCDWNQDLFYSHNMISHLGIYKISLLKEVKGFRIGLEGSQDYDLALRCIEKLNVGQIVHIPRVLYHWRIHSESTAMAGDSKPYAMIAGERAINEHFIRTGVSGTVKFVGYGYQPNYKISVPNPLVSIIIPTRNGFKILKQCIDSIFKKTSYRNYEIMIIDNGSDDPETLDYIQKLSLNEQIRIFRDNGPFNYSALNNKAVSLANGEVITLLNNDIEVISTNWLSVMVSHALRPSVGAVGAKLWYGNKTIQHGGVILGINGVASHAHKHASHFSNGYAARLLVTQSLSAVTAACLVIRKSVFNEVGGLDEKNLAVAFNDIDFCLRVRELGYRNVWVPNAELFHHESATRGYEDTPDKQARFIREVDYMKKRWGDKLLNDPAYSPNLTLDYEDFSYAWPPRVLTLVEN